MAVLIPDDYAQVTVNFDQNFIDAHWSVVFGVKQDSASGSDVANTFITAFGASLLPEMDTSLEIASVTVRTGPSSGPDPGPTVEVAWGAPGERASASVPPNTALLVRKLTAFGGRANRGRNYWPGFLGANEVSEGGGIEDERLDTLQTAFLTWAGDMGSGNSAATDPCPLVILHDETSPTTTPRLVAALSVDRLVATQRRRLRP